MAEILTIGSSVIDIFMSSNEFKLLPNGDNTLLCLNYGEKIELSTFSAQSGGGGCNTAVGFARLGHEVSCISEIGQDSWADIILKDFQTSGVKTTVLVREKREQTGVSVVLIGSDGGRTILVHRGAASQLNPADISISSVQRAEWVHVCSTSGQVETLHTIFSARHENGKQALSWNPGKGELKALVNGEISVDTITAQVLFMNKDEWETVAVVHDALAKQIPEIVITNGSSGGELIFDGISHAYSIDIVASVDDTGAGDAFATGYVAARIDDAEPIEALKWAKANSASVVQQVGAKPGLLTKSALEQAVANMA